MCTFKLVAVSNRELYQSFHGTCSMEGYADALAQLAAVGKQGKKPDILIIREKNLPESEYVKLFTSLWEKYQGYTKGKGQTVIIPHTFLSAAEKTGSSYIHLPLPQLRMYKETEESSSQLCRGQETEGGISQLRRHSDRQMLAQIPQIGVSVHSPKEAREAERLGASYVTAGHIFATDCKKGVPPRSMDFLKQVCDSVRIPVYAIGGINGENVALIRNTKASGACMMSEYMR